MESNSTVRLVSRNVAINVAGALWQFILIIVGTRIVLDRLGADSFGVLALVGGTAGYFIYLDIGIGETVTKKVSEAQTAELRSRIVSTLFFFGIGMGGLLVLLLTLFGFYGVDLLFSFTPPLMQSTTRVFLVIAAGLWLLYPLNIFSKVFVGLQMFNIYNILRVVFQTAILGGIVLILRFNNSIEAAVAAITVGGIIWKATAMVLLRRLHPEIRVRFSLFDTKLLRDLLRYKSYATVSQLSGHTIFQCDIYMIGILLNPGIMAVYSVAQVLAMKLAEVSGVLLTALFPALSSYYGSNHEEQIRKGMILSTHLMILFLFPVMAFIFFFSADILMLWVGPDFLVSSSVLKGLVVARFTGAIFSVVVITLNAVDKPHVVAWLGIIAAMSNILLDYLMIPIFGFMGAVYATIFVQAAIAVALLVIIKKSLGIQGSTFWISIFKMLVAGTVCSGFYLLPLPKLFFFVPLIFHAITFYAVYYFLIVDDENRFYLKNIAGIILSRRSA